MQKLSTIDENQIWNPGGSSRDRKKSKTVRKSKKAREAKRLPKKPPKVILSSDKLDKTIDHTKPLGCKVLVLFPHGEEEVVWADFDTRSDADVINTHEATRWRNKHKIPWGESGGSYRVMGGGTVVPQGSLQVT